MKTFAISLFVLALLSLNSFSQKTEKRVYETTRVENAPIINGQHDENEWKAGEWGSDFTQFEP